MSEPKAGESGLLPCPFCGGEAEFYPHTATGSMLVRCMSCDLWSMDWRTWNRRSQDAKVSGNNRDIAERLIADIWHLGLGQKPEHLAPVQRINSITLIEAALDAKDANTKALVKAGREAYEFIHRHNLQTDTVKGEMVEAGLGQALAAFPEEQ